jgi:hypothetical protein
LSRKPLKSGFRTGERHRRIGSLGPAVNNPGVAACASSAAPPQIGTRFGT